MIVFNSKILFIYLFPFKTNIEETSFISLKKIEWNRIKFD